MTKKDKLFTFLLITLSLVGIKALFHPGFYTSHDGETQVIRLYHFYKGLTDGQIPPRWAGQLMYHFGYPLFIFTFRLPSVIGSLFHYLGFNLTDSVKLVFILSYVASGLIMFFFTKDLFKNRTAAFFSSFLYLWAPYRFTNIFVRAAIGDHLAFVFLPLVFWSTFKLHQQPKLKWVFLGSISFACLILSHALVAQMLFIPIFIFVFTLTLITKNKKNFILYNLLMFFLGSCLTAYYFLPAYYYKRIIIKLNPFFYSDHFITLKQLLYSKWGYGFSFPGENDGFSFQVGISHWLCVAASLLILLFSLIHKKIKRNTIYIFCFLVLFLLSIFFMLEQTSPIYRKLAQIIVADFPFRLLILSVFSSSILGGLSLVFLKKKKTIFYLFLTSLFLLNLYANRNHLRVNQYLYYPDSYYMGNYWTTTSSYDEFIPKTFNKTLVKEKTPKIIFKDKVTKAEIIKEKSNLLEIQTEVKEKTQIQVNSMYFPGWQVFINDKKIKNFTTENGVFNLQIDPSVKKITLKFSETPIMRFADLISIATMFIIGLLIVKKPRLLP